LIKTAQQKNKQAYKKYSEYKNTNTRIYRHAPQPDRRLSETACKKRITKPHSQDTPEGGRENVFARN
jgi:hypothetical protein